VVRCGVSWFNYWNRSPPLSSEYGTFITLKARFWPWLSGKGPENLEAARSEALQGYLADEKTPTSLGPPSDRRHMPTVGS